MSSRKHKRVKVDVASQDDSDSECEDQSSAQTAVRGRRQRGAPGSLVDMPKMPLDIIYEVS